MRILKELNSNNESDMNVCDLTDIMNKDIKIKEIKNKRIINNNVNKSVMQVV